MNFARPNSAKGPRLRPAKISILARFPDQNAPAKPPNPADTCPASCPPEELAAGTGPRAVSYAPHFEDIDRFKAHRFQGPAQFNAFYPQCSGPELLWLP